MLTVIAVEPGVYCAVLSRPGGGLSCRLVGPPDWVLEQLAFAFERSAADSSTQPMELRSDGGSEVPAL